MIYQIMSKILKITFAAFILGAVYFGPTLTANTSGGNNLSTTQTPRDDRKTQTTNSPSNKAAASSGSGSDKDSSDTINYPEIMQKCNETYPIQIDYLVELNSTGSFPDETDKTPMCYIKCFLENIGVLKSDGAIDHDAAVAVWPNSIDAIDDCIKSQAGLFDNDPNEDCGKTYYVARCVMMKEVLASRGTNNS